MNVSLSSTPMGSELPDTSPERVITPKEWMELVIMVLVAAMAVISNVCIVIMLLRQRWQRSHGDFWKHLSIINILIGFIVMPTMMTYSLNMLWQLPQTMCRMFITSDAVLCCVNTLTMLSINVDRLLFTYRPSYHVEHTRRWQTILKILLPWLFSIGIIVPSIEFLSANSTFHYTGPNNQCYIEFGNTETIIFHTFTYYLPAFIIILSAIGQLSITMLTARENHVVHLSKVMCALDMIYLVMSVPFVSVMLMMKFGGTGNPILPHYLTTVSLWLCYSFSAVLPLVWLSYEDYRVGCWKAIRCRTRNQRRHSYLDNNIQLKQNS